MSKIFTHLKNKFAKSDFGSAFMVAILILFSVLTLTYFSINQASQEYSFYQKQAQKYEIS